MNRLVHRLTSPARVFRPVSTFGRGWGHIRGYSTPLIAQSELPQAVEQAEQIEQAEDPELADDLEELEELEPTEEHDQECDGEDEGDGRVHRHTMEYRTGPFPTTVFLPSSRFIKPIRSMIKATTSIKHVKEAAEAAFGGPGLPYSALTPRVAMGMAQKPVRLVPGVDSVMSAIQASASAAVILPAAYAACRSVVSEVRRRVGPDWIGRMVRRRRSRRVGGKVSDKPGPRVLDVGSGGAAVLAWNEIVDAEIELIDGKADDELCKGTATVVVPAPRMREKCQFLLEGLDATFTASIPAVKSTVRPTTPIVTTGSRGKDDRKKSGMMCVEGEFDVIFAPYSLWATTFHEKRQKTIDRLWKLLNPDGGLLVLIDKGTPRGFEVIAQAREQLVSLMKRRGPNPIQATKQDATTEQAGVVSSELVTDEQAATRLHDSIGTILAPCPTHSTCPLYPVSGVYRNRKDFCHFSQRLVRPAFMQTIVGASERNHTDVLISYLAVLKGDYRDHVPKHNWGLYSAPPPGIEATVTGEEATLRALRGYENDEADESGDVMALPRAILPALKRKGHILLDVCTPAATIERWTITKSLSRQAFHDGRKVRWGDLWPLGAKGRADRHMRIGVKAESFDSNDADRALRRERKKVKELRQKPRVEDD